ncbi:MAG: hypothetical protein E2O46_02860 [Ignavibacteria bacterium]|nr:MAG: hypothetical protein E2O46_02860 [Ignavibacteria bacterium]
MYKNLLIILFTIFFLYTCSEEPKEVEPEKINGKILIKLIEEALWGSEKANYRLSGLVKPDTPPPDEYNQLKIDSVANSEGIKFYSILIEYPNPLHNVLAVYNENLLLYILDNSLNGNIVTEWKNISGRLYLIASENFVSKDLLKLSRISLYRMINGRFYLVFRSFTKLDKAGKIYQQSIEDIDENKIVTQLSSNRKTKLNNKKVTFNFNSSEHKYISEKDVFTNFVLNEIKSAKWTIEKPELKLETMKKKQQTTKQTETTEYAYIELKGYQVTLNSDWNNPIGIAVTDHLISRLEGVRYINDKIGATITIIQLPEGSATSQFVKYKFGNPTVGNYRVRSTNIIESGRNYIQFFEHSCSNKTFILLLQTPKYTYDKNKVTYDEIVTSFFIEC